MRITRISAYRVELPLREGTYNWSGGKSVTVFDSTIVRVDTDAGLAGWGEVCPLGPFYLPAYAAGVRAGIAELGPHLLGEDPLELGKLNRRMDAALNGHAYVKSGIDMACWDLLGKAAGLPVCVLMGGRFGDDFVLYRAISQESPERMADKVAEYRAEGYRRFQLKVGGDPDIDVERIRTAAAKLEPGDRLVADANTGWRMHDALRVVRAVRDVDVYIEQPCPSYEECLTVRRHTDHPFVLDEVVDSIDMLVRGHADRAMDAVNIKISKFGGLTRAKQARDLCVSLGLAMTLEDSWGGDVVTAAIAHLAHSCPPEYLFTWTDFQQLHHGADCGRSPSAGPWSIGRVVHARPRRRAADGRAQRPGARRGYISDFPKGETAQASRLARSWGGRKMFSRCDWRPKCSAVQYRCLPPFWLRPRHPNHPRPMPAY